MTNQEQWLVGTKVKFNHDGLKAQGTIILHEYGGKTVTVCLDSEDEGWTIDQFECPDMTKYFGRTGWHVPYSKLVKVITYTAKGNIL